MVENKMSFTKRNTEEREVGDYLKNEGGNNGGKTRFLYII